MLVDTRSKRQGARPTAKWALTERLEHAAALGAALVIGGRHPTRGADDLGTAAAALLVARDPVEFAVDVADRAQIHHDLLRRSSADLGGALGGHSVEAGQQAEGGEHRHACRWARYRRGGWSRAARCEALQCGNLRAGDTGSHAYARCDQLLAGAMPS